jgi:hypothetical protein
VSVKITPGSAGGPANVVATGGGTIKIRVGGQHSVYYLRFAYITGPLILAEVDAENVGIPRPGTPVGIAGIGSRRSRCPGLTSTHSATAL